MERFFKSIFIIFLFYSVAVEAEDVFLTAGYSHTNNIERIIWCYHGWDVSTDSISFSLTDKKGDLFLNPKEHAFFMQSSFFIKKYSVGEYKYFNEYDSVRHFMISNRVIFNDFLAFDNLIGNDIPDGPFICNFMFRYTPIFRFNELNFRLGGGIVFLKDLWEVQNKNVYLLDIKYNGENEKFSLYSASMEKTEVIFSEKYLNIFFGFGITAYMNLTDFLAGYYLIENSDILIHAENEKFRIFLGGNLFNKLLVNRISPLNFDSKLRYLINDNLCVDASLSGAFVGGYLMHVNAGVALSARFTVPLVN
ncbi:TPA: hypothetical protein DCW38_08135 [candidate division WOR-3 bacterium]|uniref:Uncharacterized protein n=1 Tax=candidate division WOR-3 bacterium TaxID=2052148 RepID=A0A350HC64_UNCW3|nr:hypothetical protein [candidate division WOR-3 bacterium]